MKTWEIACAGDDYLGREKKSHYLESGWEPFAVVNCAENGQNDNIIYFRRLKQEPPKP